MGVPVARQHRGDPQARDRCAADRRLDRAAAREAHHVPPRDEARDAERDAPGRAGHQDHVVGPPERHRDRAHASGTAKAACRCTRCAPTSTTASPKRRPPTASSASRCWVYKGETLANGDAGRQTPRPEDERRPRGPRRDGRPGDRPATGSPRSGARRRRGRPVATPRPAAGRRRRKPAEAPAPMRRRPAVKRVRKAATSRRSRATVKENKHAATRYAGNTARSRRAATPASPPAATRCRFGDFGLKATDRGRLTARQIEAARRAMSRHVKRGGRIWIRVFPDKPISQKPAEVRMGNGKGNPEYYVRRDPAGQGAVRDGRRRRSARPRSVPLGRGQAAAAHDVRRTP